MLWVDGWSVLYYGWSLVNIVLWVDGWSVLCYGLVVSQYCVMG